jgi:hypothetical protein
MDMAKNVVTYLYYSKDLPLVLGGSAGLSLATYTDSSLATGPKRRSISDVVMQLNQQS